MTKQGWLDMSAASPCPICGKPDWCSISGDGQVVNCRREVDEPANAGWVLQSPKTDSNGDTYRVWRFAGDAVGPGGSEPKQAAADPLVLDEVYTDFVDALPLHRLPWERLQWRGLSRAELRFRRYGYFDIGRGQQAIDAALAAGLEEHLPQVPGFYKAKNGKWRFAAPSGILIRVRDLDGRTVALKVRADDPKGGNKYVYASSRKHGGPGPGAPVHVPRHDDGYERDPVRITEGELKGDIATAITRQLTLGLNGVSNFRKAAEVLTEVRPKTVIIAFDADFRTKKTVAKALVNAVRFYEQDYQIIVETWSPDDGKGIDDVLAAGKRPKRLRGDKVRGLIQELEQRFGPLDDAADRPEIITSTQEHDVNDRAVAALCRDVTIYKRGGRLVHVLPDDGKPQLIKRPAGSPRIAVLPEAVLRERLTQVAHWLRVSYGKLVPAHPPNWSVNAIIARGEWAGVRPLEGIVTGPVLRADGSVLAVPGYDPATGLLCELDVEIPPVPSKPAAKQIKAAVKMLKEVVADFPFESEAHRAVWFSFLMTILARFAFDGPSPLFLFDSNTPGAGKGLLVDATAVIATGRKMPRMVNPENDDEARKRITALAVAGDQLVLIDNIGGTLGSPSLEAAMTSDVWKDRILGRNETIELPLTPTWCATGNNVALSRDMTRRVAHVRLNSLLEKPEEREDFRHPDLLAWVTEHRGRLLAAALTILRGYCQAGHPDQKLKPWGSFDGWSALVRSAVVWAGLPDPGETRVELASRANTENQALGALLTALLLFDPDRAGVTAAEIIGFTTDEKTHSTEGGQMIREALGELCPTRGGLPSAGSVGKKLRFLVGRVVGGRFLDKRERNKTSAWFVKDVSPGGTGDTGGISTPGKISGKKKSKKSSKGETPPEHPVPPDADDVEVF